MRRLAGWLEVLALGLGAVYAGRVLATPGRDHSLFGSVWLCAFLTGFLIAHGAVLLAAFVRGRRWPRWVGYLLLAALQGPLVVAICLTFGAWWTALVVALQLGRLLNGVWEGTVGMLRGGLLLFVPLLGAVLVAECLGYSGGSWKPGEGPPSEATVIFLGLWCLLYCLLAGLLAAPPLRGLWRRVRLADRATPPAGV